MVNNMKKEVKSKDIETILKLIPVMKKNKILTFKYKDFECTFHPMVFQDDVIQAIDQEKLKKEAEQTFEDILFHSAQ